MTGPRSRWLRRTPPRSRRRTDAGAGSASARRRRAARGGGRRAGRPHRARHPPRVGRPGARGRAARPHRAPSPPGSTPASAPGCARPRAASGCSPSARSDRPWTTRTHGPVVTAVVNGLIGDRLARERPRLAVPLAVRRDGRDVPLRRDALRVRVPGSHRQRGAARARAVGERVRLRPAPRPGGLDVRRHARRARLDPGGRCGRTPGSRCARTAWPWPPCSRPWTRPGPSRSSGSRWSDTRWADC